MSIVSIFIETHPADSFCSGVLNTTQLMTFPLLSSILPSILQLLSNSAVVFSPYVSKYVMFCTLLIRKKKKSKMYLVCTTNQYESLVVPKEFHIHSMSTETDVYKHEHTFTYFLSLISLSTDFSSICTQVLLIEIQILGAMYTLYVSSLLHTPYKNKSVCDHTVCFSIFELHTQFYLYTSVQTVNYRPEDCLWTNKT